MARLFNRPSHVDEVLDVDRIKLKNTYNKTLQQMQQPHFDRIDVLLEKNPDISGQPYRDKINEFYRDQLRNENYNGLDPPPFFIDRDKYELADGDGHTRNQLRQRILSSRQLESSSMNDSALLQELFNESGGGGDHYKNLTGGERVPYNEGFMPHDWGKEVQNDNYNFTPGTKWMKERAITYKKLLAPDGSKHMDRIFSDQPDAQYTDALEKFKKYTSRQLVNDDQYFTAQMRNAPNGQSLPTDIEMAKDKRRNERAAHREVNTSIQTAKALTEEVRAGLDKLQTLKVKSNGTIEDTFKIKAQERRVVTMVEDAKKASEVALAKQRSAGLQSAAVSQDEIVEMSQQVVAREQDEINTEVYKQRKKLDHAIFNEGLTKEQVLAEQKRIVDLAERMKKEFEAKRGNKVQELILKRKREKDLVLKSGSSGIGGVRIVSAVEGFHGSAEEIELVNIVNDLQQVMSTLDGVTNAYNSTTDVGNRDALVSFLHYNDISRSMADLHSKSLKPAIVETDVQKQKMKLSEVLDKGLLQSDKQKLIIETVNIKTPDNRDIQKIRVMIPKAMSLADRKGRSGKEEFDANNPMAYFNEHFTIVEFDFDNSFFKDMTPQMTRDILDKLISDIVYDELYDTISSDKKNSTQFKSYLDNIKKQLTHKYKNDMDLKNKTSNDNKERSIINKFIANNPDFFKYFKSSVMELVVNDLKQRPEKELLINDPSRFNQYIKSTMEIKYKMPRTMIDLITRNEKIGEVLRQTSKYIHTALTESERNNLLRSKKNNLFETVIDSSRILSKSIQEKQMNLNLGANNGPVPTHESTSARAKLSMNAAQDNKNDYDFDESNSYGSYGAVGVTHIDPTVNKNRTLVHKVNKNQLIGEYSIGD
jgi:hypothetical protein